MTTDGKPCSVEWNVDNSPNPLPLDSQKVLSFGIVIPTRSKCRFLPRALAQVRSQTYPHWHCVLASDGPSPKTRALFDQHTSRDPRFSYLELAAPAQDWGLTPRLRGLDVLATLPHRPDYVAFWDDDNRFYPAALTNIAEALRREGSADLLIVPIHRQLSQLPRPWFGPPRLEAGKCGHGKSRGAP